MTSFAAAMLGSGGQLAIQYISKLTMAALFVRRSSCDRQGLPSALVAFNMMPRRRSSPFCLSQIWQDFSRCRSRSRPGHILTIPESADGAPLPPTPRGGRISSRQPRYRGRNDRDCRAIGLGKST
jgi:subfamily B ATP-binding cassette protein HlyB/CyaB